MHEKTTLQLAHTAELDASVRDQIRELLWAVFDDMAEHDYEHGLGGTHALIWDGADLVAHASLVMRFLMHGDRMFRAGYVECVAVRSDHQRHGIGAAVMAPLEHYIHAAYELGALGTTDEGMPFYLSRGWQPWRGELRALTPDGVVATPDEQGAVLVLPVTVPLDLDGTLTADWRDGDVW